MNTQVTEHPMSDRYDTADLKSLQDEFGQLRNQIETIARDAAAIGRARMHTIEDQTTEIVRDRPVQSLAIALGAGFLLALLLRR
jgi:ElaB/YqjD/DUF883 family membrane-anchored ribosome-binding protein